MDRQIRALLRAVVALATAAGLMVGAASALANAANPVAGSTVVDSVVVNSDGSTTVTVHGQWDWASQTKCPSARNGVGYQVDWFDNQTNAIGTSTSPDGILYVGDSQDNIVHSDESQPPSGSGYATPGGPFDGVPLTYLSHNQSDTTPTSTDAANWFGECSGITGGVTSGTWGPISHTYAPTATKPLQLCPIMYDPHGGSQNSGKSSVQDITAGANSLTKNYNSDNSYQTNGTGPNGNQCPKISIPTITTSASSATAGNPIHDSATVSGSGGATGTISWNVYAASDTGCKTALNSSPITKSVSGDGTFQSPDFTPSGPGSYQWVATYSNSTVSGLKTSCNDPNEVSNVTPAKPTISTSATSGPAGGSVQDTATVSGGDNPTGTVTFNLYNNSSCSGAAVFTDTEPLSNGTAPSKSFMPSSAGTYYWIATYNGDTNNNAVSGKCGDIGETSTIGSVAPSIATSATSTTVGGSIQDTALVSGGDNPTGTVTFKLYSDSSCTKVVFSDTETLSGGSATSKSFTPASAGSYNWIATYNGDTNNNPVSGKCGDDGETSTVSPASPSIVTDAMSSAVVGDVIKDNATLSGGSAPTGTITWHLYSDAACSSLVDTITVPVNGDGTYTVSPGFTTSSPGVYYWVAKYSGDANNNAVSTSCGDPNEETTVSSPGIRVEKLDSVPCADLADVTQPPGITPCNGTWSAYTHGIITLKVPHSGSYSIPINYQIRVTNTGSEPLALSLNDPLCDSGSVSGPTLVQGTGTLNGTTLSAGGSAYFTCTHTLTQNDPNTSISGQPFTNTATVTGTPLSGPPVRGTDIVTVDRQPLPPPQPKPRFCRNFKTHKKVSWPKGTPKPKACKRPKPHPKRPRHPRGFTG